MACDHPRAATTVTISAINAELVKVINGPSDGLPREVDVKDKGEQGGQAYNK